MNEKFDHFINILIDKKPEFKIRYDNPLLGSTTNLPSTDYLNYLKFWSADDFKTHMYNTLEYLTFEFKKEFASKKLELNYLEVISDELTKTLKTYYNIKINNQKHVFQEDLTIYFLEPDQKKYYKFEEIEPRFQDEILTYLNTKYDIILRVLETIGILTDKPIFQAEILKENQLQKTARKQSSGNKTNSKVYSLDDIAEMFQVTKRTIYNWKGNGTLPFTQIGSKIYLTQQQLDDFLQYHQIKPANFRR